MNLTEDNFDIAIGMIYNDDAELDLEVYINLVITYSESFWLKDSEGNSFGQQTHEELELIKCPEG